MSIVKYLIVSLFGQKCNGVVKGYENDLISFKRSRKPAQVVLIKIDTDDGPRLIRYQLFSIKKIYSIGSTISIKRYKNLYKI
jgi:hypothetical protein